MHQAEERDRPTAARGRASLPIVAVAEGTVSAAERRRIDDLAARLLRDEPGLGRTEPFGPRVSAGLTDAPALLIGDQREMAMKTVGAVPVLEHRMALLGRRGDLLAVERPASSFLRFLDDILPDGVCCAVCLGPAARGRPRPVPERCRGEDALLDDLARRARAAGGFQLLPHIGTGWVWVLAGAVAARSGCPVAVAAPPPNLTQRVNDKLWFARVTRAVLGRDAVPASYAAYGPTGVAGHLKRLAARNGRVVIKVPHGSGGEGNFSMVAEDVAAMPAARLRALLIATLRRRGWDGRFPLLVGVWDADAVSSPSVQLWIPPMAEGAPVIDGIFEQIVEGTAGTFVGATPATLAPALFQRLADEAAQLALLFQHLGYVGRCSLDALVVGRDCPQVHWIECNGRWGGVSVPLVLARRLRGAAAFDGFAIAQNDELPLATRGVAAALRGLDGLIFDPVTGRGVVPLSATMFDRGRGIHLAALAATQPAARALVDEAIGRLAADNAAEDAGP